MLHGGKGIMAQIRVGAFLMLEQKDEQDRNRQNDEYDKQHNHHLLQLPRPRVRRLHRRRLRGGGHGRRSRSIHSRRLRQAPARCGHRRGRRRVAHRISRRLRQWWRVKARLRHGPHPLHSAHGRRGWKRITGHWGRRQRRGSLRDWRLRQVRRAGAAPHGHLAHPGRIENARKLTRSGRRRMHDGLVRAAGELGRCGWWRGRWHRRRCPGGRFSRRRGRLAGRGEGREGLGPDARLRTLRRVYRRGFHTRGRRL